MTESETTNPYVEPVLDDVKNRSTWADRDEQIIRRRLSERKKKKTKPYAGAPNTVVPVVDDIVRERTDQERTMMENANRTAYFIPLDAGQDPQVAREAEVAFDTYWRHILHAGATVEEGLDCKNARGFAVFKVFRKTDERWGELPAFDCFDPRDVIVPASTKRMGEAERIAHVYRYGEREFREIAKAREWQNVDEIVEACLSEKSDGQDLDESTIELSEALVGVDLAGESEKKITVIELWHYAGKWDVERDPLAGEGEDAPDRIVEGRRCVVVFAVKAPELVLALYPWRERDELRPLTMSVAMPDGRVLQQAVGQELVMGKDRAWPFVQCRFENRSRYYYDTRGIGQLCMDDQITATALQNAMLTMTDYYCSPMFSGPGGRSGTNITHAPGSVIPEGYEPVNMPPVPPSLDFGVERFKRAAARRGGALSQYEFSGDLGAKKRVQKTATEVEEESMRSGMISSASVDRFNSPMTELFQQLWEELQRMRWPLPMIQDRVFKGQVNERVYAARFLIVPASNSKTFNPDQQFVRDRAVLEFLLGTVAQMGVPINVQAATEDILSNWDPIKRARWLIDPRQAGANGEPPVYMQLAQLRQAVVAMGQQVLGAGGERTERTQPTGGPGVQG